MDYKLYFSIAPQFFISVIPRNQATVIWAVILHDLDKNLLAAFLPLITHIIVNQSSYDDRCLQAAATLALGKYMLLRWDRGPTFAVIPNT